MISAEDSAERVLRPRLEAAQARLERVHLWQLELHWLCLPEEIEALEAEIVRLNAVLVVLDPLDALLSDAIDSHRNHHIRRALGPLAQVAERTATTVLVVAHLRKNAGSDPLTAVVGSVAYTAAARQVLLAAEDAEKQRHVLAVVKSNLAPPPPPLAYGISEARLGGGVVTSRIEWQGEAPEVDVAELLREPQRKASTTEQVATFIASYLGEEEKPASEVEAAVREVFGTVSKATITRARALAGVETRKSGQPGEAGQWMWSSKISSKESEGWNLRDDQDFYKSADNKTAGHLEGFNKMTLLRESETWNLRNDHEKRTESDPVDQEEACAPQVTPEGCLHCGCRSDEPGYHGHAMGCPLRLKL